MSSRASRARSDVVPRRRASWDTAWAPASRWRSTKPSPRGSSPSVVRQAYAATTLDARARLEMTTWRTRCVAPTTFANSPRCGIAKDYSPHSSPILDSAASPV